MADLSHAPRDLVVEIRDCIRRIKLLAALNDAEAWAIVEDGERVIDRIRSWLGGT